MNIGAISQKIGQRPDYRWWVLVTLGVCIFINVIDMGATTVALPSIGADFGADLSRVQWVALGYTLAIATLLLPMARLGDIVGRKAVFIAGYTVFALAGIMGGLAPNLSALVLAKVFQGVGSAMIQANLMAMTISVFPSAERGKVLGINVSIVGSAGVVGPAAGGFLVSAFGWQSVLFVNVATGIVAVAVAALVLDARQFIERSPGGRRPAVDWVGAVLSALVLLVFLLSMTNGYKRGWHSPLILSGFGLFLALLTAFIVWELRAPSPMLDLRLFKNKVLALSSAASWLNFLGTSSVLFMMPFYFQRVLGYPPSQAGLIMIPSSLCFAVVSPFAGILSDRVGTRWFTVGGMALSMAAAFILSLSLTAHSPLPFVIFLLMMHFTGMGLFNSPNNSAIYGSVERRHYGVVTALTQLVRNSASVTGLAMGTMIIVATMGSLGYAPRLDAVTAADRAGVGEAFATGVRHAFLAIGCVFTLALACSFAKSERASKPQEGTPARGGATRASGRPAAQPSDAAPTPSSLAP